MCGIAGFSLSADSKIKPRKLANALLTAIEDRGYMAAGFAYQDGSHLGWHKAAGLGSQLSLKTMPKDAKNVILHTRLATHGAVTDNRNNHPVLSPAEDIALVHNGVIYNHDQVRKQLGMTLPDVDTSVIPAVIEQWGLDKISTLDGDAAIAWFNRNEQGVLHLARYQYSPLVMAQVEDGSFIFCSTEQLLWKALIQLDLLPVWMETASELEYYTITDGVITSKSILPEPEWGGSRYDYSYFRHQTAGAKGHKPLVVTAWDDEYWDTPKYGNDRDDTEPEVDESVTEEEITEMSLPERVRYYTEVYNREDSKQETYFYYPNEKDLWSNELFIIAQEPYIDLLDYGVVVRGELVSQLDLDLF
jgi:hypothetical protein